MKGLSRLPNAANGAIISNALSMFGAMAVTSGLGAAYWLLAAHLFTGATVGFAGASIAAMTLLGNAGMLGFGTLLIGELPNHNGQEWRFIGAALATVGIAGAALGVLFALAAPLVAPNLHPLAGGAGTIGLFALGAALTAVTAVLDQALVGLLRGGLQFRRNAYFAAIKLAALLAAGLWLAQGNWLTIYTTWLIGNLASLALLAIPGMRRRGWSLLALPRSRGFALSRYGMKALRHHWLNLALQLPGYAMPVVVIAVLSPTQNAYFYIASMIAGLVFYGPLALVTALYAAGARDPDALAQRIKFTLGVALAAGVLVNVLLLISADYVLGIFGPAYAHSAAWTLRILGLAVFPVIIKDHYVTVNRIRGRMSSTALLATAGALLELALAAGAGIATATLWGFTTGWVAALFIEAAVMMPYLYSAVEQERRHLPAAA